MKIYPNLYIVLVGPSAAGKGTAMGPGYAILSEIPNIKLSAQATSYQALIKHLQDTNLTDVDLKTGKQTYHSSLTVFSKEFTVFLRFKDLDMISALCDWYDCDKRWSYETIARHKEEIIGVWLNIIGGTTPDMLQSSLPTESFGSGLTSRIIFVYEEDREKIVTLPIETKAEKELFGCLVHDLEQITTLSGDFRCTEKFLALWNDWCYKACTHPPFTAKIFDGYNGRRRLHLMKLAMVMCASRAKVDGADEMVMTEYDLNRGIEALNEVEVKMPNTFRGVGKSDIAGLITNVIRYLYTQPTQEVPVWQLARNFDNDMDSLTLNRVITTLELTKTIKIVHRPQGDDTIKVLK